MSDKIFAKGFYLKTPHENAPDYVKRKVSVNVDEFIEFLQAHRNDSGYVNFDLKEAKSTHWYMEVDDWQPDNSGGDNKSQSESKPAGNSEGFKPFAPPPFGGKKSEDGLFQEDFEDDIPF